MGGEQARQIAKAGFELAVYDVFPEALARFDGLAQLSQSPADAARDSDLLQICVRDDAQVWDALYGEQGAAAALQPGALVIVHSTITLDMVTRLDEALARQGLRFMDAPVSRTSVADDGRFVFTMTGGEPSLTEEVRSVLESFSTGLENVGPCGAAMALKIANNLVTWVQLMVGSQAVKLATHFGVPFEDLVKVMQSNGNLTPTMEAALKGQQAVPAGDNPEYDAFMSSQAGIGEKDLQLAAQSGELAGLDMSMALEAQKLVRPTFERH